ncbi:MAG: hypothetical protein K2L55_06140 [Muribaculaceae bacterium]|nr:hypothetical protein [Muribaculaceae bacterium]MDE6346232.1 hypothetical protein [Muribaculaceae bacterium]
MKFKYFALLSLGALAVTSCSDDDNTFNTDKDVTVELAEATIRVSEDQASSTSYNYIPVVVNGKTNGPVQVTIEVMPYGEEPAEADVNYVFTSYTINIPAGETSGMFQYYPKGNDDINNDRSFEVKIVDVKGATVGAQNNTVVTLVDNEGLIPVYYSGLAGAWDAVMESTYDGPVGQSFVIVTAEEGAAGYGKDVTLVDFPATGMQTSATFSIDGVTQEIFLSIPSGQTLGQMTHPTYGLGKELLYPVSGNSYTTAAYDFMLKFGFDLKSGQYIQDPEYNFGILVSFSAGMMMYDQFSAMNFMRN